VSRLQRDLVVLSVDRLYLILGDICAFVSSEEKPDIRHRRAKILNDPIPENV
jgi:hypothetical protein